MTSEVSFLVDIGLAVFAALALSLLFRKLGLPLVTGQLAAGIVIGPFGLGLIQDLTIINLMASLGIVLLLFVIGLELDPKELKNMGLGIFIFTFLELTISFLGGLTAGILVGLSLLESLFIATIISLSSTAIVGKILLEQRTVKEKESIAIMAALVIEDSVAVFLLLVLPGLSIAQNVPVSDVFVFASKGVLLTAAIVLFGLKIGPRLINFVSQYEVEYGEVTFLLALGLGFFFGVVSSFLGFSPAIGAFLTGLMIMGKASRYISAKVRPIKDLFIVLFFVSMGTLIDLRALTLVTIPMLVILSTGIGIKFTGAWLGSKLSGVSGKPSQVGFAMLPRGEFSFIAAKAGTDLGLGANVFYPVAGLLTFSTSLVGPLALRAREGNSSPSRSQWSQRNLKPSAE